MHASGHNGLPGKMLLWRPAVPTEICTNSYAFATVAVFGGTTFIYIKRMITARDKL
jgi:hypothetical protein